MVLDERAAKPRDAGGVLHCLYGQFKLRSAIQRTQRQGAAFPVVLRCGTLSAKISMAARDPCFRSLAWLDSLARLGRSRYPLSDDSGGRRVLEQITLISLI